jgi:hypothetical protein
MENLADLNLLDPILPNIDRFVRTPSYTTAWRHVLMTLSALSDIHRMLSGDTPDHLPHWICDDFDNAVNDIQRPLLDHLAIEAESDITRNMLIPWAVLFYSMPEAAEIAKRRLTALRFSRHATDFVTRLLRDPDSFDRLPVNPTSRQIYQYYQTFGEAGPVHVLLALANLSARNLLARQGLGAALSRQAWRAQLTKARTLWIHYIHHPEIIDPQPLLSGRDILALGVAHGPRIGHALASLREAQAAGKVETVADARDYIRRWMKT